MNGREHSGEEERMDKTSRDKALRALWREYRRSRKKRKGELLDAYCTTTGINRKHAIVQLSNYGQQRPRRKKAGRPALYQNGLLKPLAVVWRASGWCCAELLHPVRMTLLKDVERWGHVSATAEERALMEGLSCSTLKRLLRRIPCGKRRRKRPAYSRPWRARVPLSCTQPKPTRPGTFECDLVEHNGGSSSGEYGYTVHGVDKVTSWRTKRACLGKQRHRIERRFKEMRQAVPYRIKCIDTDNDRAMLNETLLAWAEHHGIKVERSRPYQKNDNAHIEQKNGTDVRGLVGYRRYDTEQQIALLNELYALDDLHINLFVPVRKLISRTRNDEYGSWRKTYDIARTPLQRVLERPKGEVAPAIKRQLKTLAAGLDPLALQERKERLLARLAHMPSRCQLFARATTDSHKAGRTPTTSSRRPSTPSDTTYATITP